jgi:hypothetical protein
MARRTLGMVAAAVAAGLVGFFSFVAGAGLVVALTTSSQAGMQWVSALVLVGSGLVNLAAMRGILLGRSTAVMVSAVSAGIAVAYLASVGGSTEAAGMHAALLALLVWQWSGKRLRLRAT